MSEEPHITYFHMGQWPVYCGFTTSPKKFEREMSRLSITDQKFIATDYANATTHILTKEGVLTFIITMAYEKKRSIEQVASMIAHEAVHVAQEMWQQFGEREPGREAEAYLVQHVVQCCLQEYFKTGRVRRSAP